MALITWSSFLSTGFDEQDNQHKILINLINQLNDAREAGKGADVLGEILSELLNYTVFHFDYEERLMEQYNYVDTPSHKIEHTKLIQTVTDFKRNFDTGVAPVSVEIMNFLRDWLTDHIMKTDKKLGKVLVKLEPR